jgi:hypothetical protein
MILLHGFIKTRKTTGADLEIAFARKRELEK